MDFLFISMPYARFISRWFANMPNINLGIMQALLTGKGKKTKTFHFHLDFLPYIKGLDPGLWEKFLVHSEQCGVEYMGLDYVFAALFFKDKFSKSGDRLRERLASIELSPDDFFRMMGIANSFIEQCFRRIEPYLHNVKLVGFSSSHYQLSSSLLMASRIKSIKPDMPIIIGGKDCSGSFAYDLLKNTDCVDYAGVAECESTVESLLEHLEDRNRELFNVIYKEKDGSIKRTSLQPNLPMNSLPFPVYAFNDFPVPVNEIILPVEFGRGCPWKRCTFCPDESYNIQCRPKSAERLVEEFEYYRNISPELSNFFILDSDALKDKETIKAIPRYTENRDLAFHYAEFRAERMDRDVLNAVLHFGRWISNFQIGIETFSDSLLKLMNKGVTALKNVEVIKAATELGVPIQFNLFTCYPGMNADIMNENLNIIYAVQHLLVYDNIQMFPGEFYLPTDCAVFDNPEKFGITKHSENIFSSIFEGFPMPSYSNYPYPYRFDNDEEQFRMSMTIRETCEAIKKKHPEDNYMRYEVADNSMIISLYRDGIRTSFTLRDIEKDIYLSAAETIQQTEDIALKTGVTAERINSILGDFEQKGIVLLSPDRKSFLSLATKTPV